MKRHLLTMAMAMMLVAPSALQAKVQHLLPKPQQITATENVAAFALSGSVTINYSEGAEKCALLEEFFKFTGFLLAVRSVRPARKIDYVMTAGMIGMVYGNHLFL